MCLLHVNVWPIWIASINSDVRSMWSIHLLRAPAVIILYQNSKTCIGIIEYFCNLWQSHAIIPVALDSPMNQRPFKSIDCVLHHFPIHGKVKWNGKKEYQRKFAYCKILGQQRRFFIQVVLLRTVRKKKNWFFPPETNQ